MVHLADPLVSVIEKMLSATFQHAHGSSPSSLPRLCATVCDIFDSDGCVISHIPDGLSANRAKYIHVRAGGYPADRIQSLLRRCSDADKPVCLHNSETGGGPAIVAKAVIGEMVIYRHKTVRHFSKQDAKLAGALWRHLGKSEAREELGFSPRSRQVLTCLLDGFAEKQIAVRLGISRNTVHVHIKKLYRKLGVNSRSQLMVRCLKPDWAPVQSVYSIAERPDVFSGSSKVKVKSREIRPCNEIIPTAFPVSAIENVNSNMLLGQRQAAGQ